MIGCVTLPHSDGRGGSRTFGGAAERGSTTPQLQILPSSKLIKSSADLTFCEHLIVNLYNNQAVSGPRFLRQLLTFLTNP
jgi:hypothetical protein